MVTVLALAGLTKTLFGRYAFLKIFPSDHQVRLVVRNSVLFLFFGLVDVFYSTLNAIQAQSVLADELKGK